MRKVILISCAGVVLTACQQTPPPRRAGLWQESLARDGKTRNLGPIGSIKVCVDAARDGKNPVFSYDAATRQAKAKHCQSPQASRGLDGTYSFSSTCPAPNGIGTILVKGTASGDFTTRYHLHVETIIDRPAPFTALNSHHVDDIDGTWQGLCPPGMAPGDMMLANGMKLPNGAMVDPHGSGHRRGPFPAPDSPAPVTRP